jgi:RNA polymerase sigma-70 factor (ECF subfamily)
MEDGAAETEGTRTRLQRGDEAALGDVFARNRDRLWRVVHFRMDRRLHGRLDPDDVLQEGYLAAAKRLKHYDGSVSPFVWLRGIVLQTLIDLHRRHLGAQKRDAARDVHMGAMRYPEATSTSLAFQLAGDFTSPSQAAARAEVFEMVEEAISGMKPVDQEVLALRHFEELSNAEVAEVLDIEPNAASNRYVRALRRLQEVLSRFPGLVDEDEYE